MLQTDACRREGVLSIVEQGIYLVYSEDPLQVMLSIMSSIFVVGMEHNGRAIYSCNEVMLFANDLY